MEEIEETIEKINKNYGFPGVIDAIDGTHIKIIAPRDHSDSYNRKHLIESIFSSCCFALISL